MQSPKLQERKIRQAIRRYGVDYSFTRPKQDDFNQPVLDPDGNPEIEVVSVVKGIFHESGKTFVLITTNAAQVQSKPSPTVLAMFEDVQKLQINDLVTIPPENGVNYKVVAVNNLGNVNLFADISLEAILDGVQV